MYILLMVIITVFSEFREIHHLADNMCTVAGLHPGRTYSFRVKAMNEAGVRYSHSEKMILCLICAGSRENF